MKKMMFACLSLGTIIVFGPESLLGHTATDFGGAEIVEEASKIMSFIFGPLMLVLGVFGGAIGVIKAVLSSSIQPLLLFGGIGLCVVFIPKFIYGVYAVSGMMLP